MKDENDILTKELMEHCGLDLNKAIEVMLHIRFNARRYFYIGQKEA